MGFILGAECSGRAGGDGAEVLRGRAKDKMVEFFENWRFDQDWPTL
jgi:hypothetical protein